MRNEHLPLLENALKRQRKKSLRKRKERLDRHGAKVQDINKR